MFFVARKECSKIPTNSIIQRCWKISIVKRKKNKRSLLNAGMDSKKMKSGMTDLERLNIVYHPENREFLNMRLSTTWNGWCFPQHSLRHESI